MSRTECPFVMSTFALPALQGSTNAHDSPHSGNVSEADMRTDKEMHSDRETHTGTEIDYGPQERLQTESTADFLPRSASPDF